MKLAKSSGLASFPLVILVFLSCPALGVGAEDLASLMGGLSSKDARLSSAAVDGISKAGEAGLAALRAHFYPDMEKALEDIGAESHLERESATRLLESRGIGMKDRIAERLRSSDDPEVRMRCRRILDALKFRSPGTEDARAFFNACRVVFRPGIPVVENRLFYEEFFSNDKYAESFPELANAALDNLDEAGADGLPLVRKALQCVRGRAEFEHAAKIAMKRDSGVVSAILSRIESGEVSCEKMETELLRREDAREFVLKRVAENSRINPPFFNALRNMNDFERVYKGDQELFLYSPSPKVQALGLRLIKSDPKPYLDKIIELVRKSHDEATRGDYVGFFQILQTYPDKSVFVPYAEEFLKSKAHASREFALSLLESDADALMKGVFRSVSSTDNDYDIKQAAETFAKKFPGRESKLEQFMVDRILASKIDEIRNARAMSKTLHDFFKYSGSDFDAWWSSSIAALLAEEKKKRRISLEEMIETGFYLNVDRESIFRHLFAVQDDYGAGWPYYIRGFTAWFLKSPLREKYIEKHCEIMRSMDEKRIERNYRNFDSFLCELFEDSPDDFMAAMKCYLGMVSRSSGIKLDSLCRHELYMFEVLGMRIGRHRRIAEELKPYVHSENPAVRIMAAATLAYGGGEREFLHKPLLKLLRLDGIHVRWKMLKLLLLADCPPENLQGLSFDFDGEEFRDHDLQSVLEALPVGEEARGCLPFLHSLFEKALSDRKTEHAMKITEFILEINLEDEKALAFLNDLAMKGTPDEAAASLYILSRQGKVPEIAPERWDFLYANYSYPATFNDFLHPNARNIENAYPAVIKNMDRFVGAYSPFGKLLWQKPENGGRFIGAILEKCSAPDVRTRQTFCETLCNVPEELAKRIPEFKRIFESQNDAECVSSLVWAAANVGQAAGDLAPLVSEVMKKSDHENTIRCLYALARISPDREVRLQSARRLMEEFTNAKEADKWLPATTLGRIPEFKEIMEPFMVDALLRRDGGKRSVYYYDKLVYSLLWEKPFSQAAKGGITAVIRDNKGRTPDERDSCLSAIFWCLRENPEEAMYFMEDIEALHPGVKRERLYRWNIAFLRRFQKGLRP